MANRDEVEEFLRRAAARRAAAQQQQQRPAAPQQPPQGWPAPPPPPQQPYQPPRPQQPYPQQQQRRPASLAEVVILEPVPTLQPVEAEVVDAELAEQTDRLGRYVAQDLRGAQEIAEQVRHLGAEVDQADEKLEAHLHQVFDHKVGQLKKQAIDSVPKTPEVPAEAITLSSTNIADMMRSPQAIRNAIILGEVLHRPEERW
jgi:hypothetical protein